MSDPARSLDLPRGEARSKVHWGAEESEVLELLRTKHGIDGDAARAIVDEAFAARRSYVRKKALIGLAFASVGIGIAAVYFGIQVSVGFVVIGFGPILMALLGVASLLLAARSLRRVVTGESEGPA